MACTKETMEPNLEVQRRSNKSSNSTSSSKERTGSRAKETLVEEDICRHKQNEMILVCKKQQKAVKKKLIM
jgi:hypothetical protein